MKNPGPPRTACTPENVGRARAAFLQSPDRSARKHFRTLAISRSGLARVLNKSSRSSIQSRLFKNWKLKITELCYEMQTLFVQNNNAIDYLLVSDQKTHKKNFKNCSSFPHVFLRRILFACMD